MATKSWLPESNMILLGSPRNFTTASIENFARTIRGGVDCYEGLPLSYSCVAILYSRRYFNVGYNIPMVRCTRRFG